MREQPPRARTHTPPLPSFPLTLRRELLAMNNHYLSANNASGDPTQRARNRTCGLQARSHADTEAQRGKTNSLEEGHAQAFLASTPARRDSNSRSELTRRRPSASGVPLYPRPRSRD